MPISRRTVLGLPLALAASRVAASSGITGGGRRGVTFGLSLEPTSLDPTTAPSASIGGIVHDNVLEGLTQLTEHGGVQPLLAREWHISPDGKRYTFTLEKNVRFHDGSTLDANTVKFSIERAKSIGNKNKLQDTLFNNIGDIIAHGTHTVELVLNHPDPNTLFRLAESPAVIVHPDTASQTARHPVGTGPFLFDHRSPGTITLMRWPDFRDADKIHLGHATFHFIEDPRQQLHAVQQNEVDVLFNIATDHVALVQQNPRYEVLLGNSNSKGLLALNNRRAPLDDVRIRRAITHAIDREGFIRHALGGRGRAIGSHFAPTGPGYINLTAVYPYDPSMASALLRDADVDTPLSLTLSLPPTPYARAGGPIIADALSRVGIEITQELLSWPEWLDGPFSGHFDMTIINHVEPLDYPIYTRPDYYFGYDSAAFRELVRRHRTSTNPRIQRTLFRDIQRHLATDAVNAWLFTPQICTVVRKGLKGVWMNYPIFRHSLSDMYWE